LDLDYNLATQIDLRDYWKWTGPNSGEITCPADISTLSIWSRPLVKYGVKSVLSTLPAFADMPSGSKLHFGFGDDDMGLLTFSLDEPTSGLICHSRRMAHGAGPSQAALDITSLLPGDYDTARHWYQVEMHRGYAEFFIDGDIVAIIVSGGRMGGWELDPPPYGVAVAPHEVLQKSATRIDFDNTGSEALTWETSPHEHGHRDGDPMPSRTYRLYDYQADTLLTEGTYDTGTSYKSHPVPGLRKDSIRFRADTASVTDGLRVEALTQEGNWRALETYDLAANDLWYADVNAEVPLIRIGYEPSADGASITDAEVSVR